MVKKSDEKKNIYITGNKKNCIEGGVSNALAE